MTRRSLAVLCATWLLPAVACTTSDDSSTPTSPGYDASYPDGAHPAYDAALPDVLTADDAADAADTTVSPIDTGLPDSNQPDTTVADTSAPDTNVPDTNLADTNVPDTDVPDTNVPDTNVPDTAPPTCLTAIYGDHYVKADGTVWYLGGQHYQIVYDADDSAVTGLTDIIQASNHACGLRDDGTVWCWPLPNYVNQNGELGNGTIDGQAYNQFRATQVRTNGVASAAPAYLSGVTAISSQSNTFYTWPVCAVRSDKSVWCWGAATQGNLFHGTTGTNNSMPYAVRMAAGPVPSDGGAQPMIVADQVAVGGRHICLLNAGKVSCFGANVAGNLGIGGTNSQDYPAAVDETTGLPATVDAIGVGSDFTCALASGGVWCWGSEAQTGNRSVPHAVCNSNFCHDKPVPVEEALPDGGASSTLLAGVTRIRIGYLFGCAVDGTGMAKCWGLNTSGTDLQAAPFVNMNTQAPSGPFLYLSAWGEGSRDALRYVTPSGTYVSGNQVVTGICP